jgi:hypothetical protein
MGFLSFPSPEVTSVKLELFHTLAYFSREPKLSSLQLFSVSDIVSPIEAAALLVWSVRALELVGAAMEGWRAPES